jgi:hypothetical protein
LPLEGGDVRCLRSLRTLGHFEFNRLSVIQRLVPLRLNRGEMDENVLAGLPLDESKSLAGIEPLYCSLFFQLCFSFLFELFGAVSTASSQKKGCKCGLAALQQYLKVLQEQQTQFHRLMLSLTMSTQFGGHVGGYVSSMGLKPHSDKSGDLNGSTQHSPEVPSAGISIAKFVRRR